MKQLANINSQVKIHDVVYPKHTDALPWELSSDSQFSINAEEAWRVTKGSSEVTVAIIDDGFDASRLPENARFELLHVCKSSSDKSRKIITHGSHLAELIIGNREGYPGVAPGCRLIMIDLPSVCTETEEALAFDIALNKNAAVVCCAWGEPSYQASHSMPEIVANSIDKLVQNSRNGLGTVVLFAVGNNNNNVRTDVYASYPSVTAVAGISKDGQRPHLMDYGDNIAFAAPVSSLSGKIGGHKSLPPGTSGAVALSAGVTALVFSANQSITANQAVTILNNTTTLVPKTNNKNENTYSPLLAAPSSHLEKWFGSGILHASDAVYSALQTTSELIEKANIFKGIYFIKGRDEPRLRERRFIGGEHTLLGHFGVSALQTLFHDAAEDPSVAFFMGRFDSASFRPDNSINPSYNDIIKNLIIKFFSAAEPGSRLPGFDIYCGSLSYMRRVPYGYLLGLAGDIYGSPKALHNDLNRGIFEFVQIFSDEMRSNFEEHSDVDIVIASEAQIGPSSDHAHYLDLAKKNYSHFAGDNLLFYLGHHLQAVMSAAKVCESAIADNVEEAEHWFKMALLSEAFAGHFLTDMFSAGHARVPRYAFLHEIFKKNKGDANLLSSLLHNHDGRLGVFMRNETGHLWYAHGDSLLLQHRDNNVVNSDIPSMIFNNEDDELGVYGLIPSVSPTDPMRPMDLASSLVFASLADVFRNMATGMSPVLPALLSEVEMSKTGLIRYILERVPFALPHSQLTANNDALVNHFDGGLVENASMTARISNVESLYETLSDVHIGVKCFVSTDLFKVSLSKKPLFEGGIWSKYLQPTNLDDWSNKQTEHLEEYLQIGPKYLSKIGDLISSRHPQTTLVEGYSPIPPNGLPVSWKNAVPESLRLALISRGNNGIWR